MNKKSTAKVHQGELLRDLYNFSNLPTIEEFSKKFKKSRVWTGKAFKWELIPAKDKYTICRAFGVPLEYFDGAYKLIVKPDADMKTVEKKNNDAELQKVVIEKMELMSELIERDRKIFTLQEEVIRLMKLIQKDA